MSKTHVPDKLAQEAAKARAAGMSYGQWKALQPVVVADPRAIPDGWKACEYCGKPFKGKVNKRFCEVGCRLEAYNERMKKAQAEQ